MLQLLVSRSTKRLLAPLCIFIIVILAFQMLLGAEDTDDKVVLSDESVFRAKKLILDQSDPALLDFIRRHHLFSPSTEPYNLTDPFADPCELNGTQWKTAQRYLGNKTGGFFIECGANDGELLSPTLVLERDYGWNGILIEGDPNIIPDLLRKHRKAWVSDVCLSTKPYPQLISMMRMQYGKGGGVIEYGWEYYMSWVYNKAKHNNTYPVKCLPFFSIMSALGVFEVDFFSLDVEWAEFPVLKTIPFDKIYIKVMIIEVLHMLKEVVAFMVSKGYRCMGALTPAEDYVFVHEKHLKSTGEPPAFGKCEHP